jgi:uncharacterized protein
VKKEFITCTELRNNAIKLAFKIYRQIGIPDIIYVLLRGGALLGNVFSEYFKILNSGKRPVYYAAVVARSYRDIRNRDTVKVDGWTYSPEYLRQGDRILLVDDIFDTGTTINHLVGVIMSNGIQRSEIKIAVHDYKERTYISTQPPITPDFYYRKLVLKDPHDDIWIHYLTHELQDLTSQEVDACDLNEDKSLAQALDLLKTKGFKA